MPAIGFVKIFHFRPQETNSLGHSKFSIAIPSFEEWRILSLIAVSFKNPLLYGKKIPTGIRWGKYQRL
jgi:hypothetical protein